jgi:hypothetical protein
VKVSIFTHDHFPPHFHAIFAEFEELIIIETLETYAARNPLPKKKRELVLNWASDKQEALLNFFFEINPELIR